MTDFSPEFGTGGAGSFEAAMVVQVVGGLIVIALSSLAAWIWRGLFDKRRQEEAVNQNYVFVLNLTNVALCANNHEIVGAARNLIDGIEARFGPVLSFSKGASGLVKALDQALAGKKDVEKKPEVGPQNHSGGCGAGAGTASAATAASLVAPVIVNVLGGAPAGQASVEPAQPVCKAEPGPAAKAPQAKVEKVTVDMSADEQVHALARAVRDFHAWWNQPRVRKAELLAIVAALTTPPPAAPVGDHTGNHAHRHGH